MRKSVLLGFTLLVAACARQPTARALAVDSVCVRLADSLRIEVARVVVHAAEQDTLYLLTEKEVKRLAKIVARDPSQTRFIVGWVNRAFQGTAP